MNIRVLLTLIVLLLAPTAKADSSNSTEFIGRCRNGIGGNSFLSDYMYCAGFITGATNALVVMGNAPFCVKGSITVEQMIRIYLKWADQNPEGWGVPPAASVLRAFVVSFPCTKK